MPILVLKAWDDSDDKVGLSANSAIVLPPEGDAQYVEPAAGSAFQAQSDFISSLEEQMSNLGISTLCTKNAAETAESDNYHGQIQIRCCKLSAKMLRQHCKELLNWLVNIRE